MIRKDFRRVFPARLKPGKYTYKFVVDGKWILDPGNDLWKGMNMVRGILFFGSNPESYCGIFLYVVDLYKY